MTSNCQLVQSHWHSTVSWSKITDIRLPADPKLLTSDCQLTESYWHPTASRSKVTDTQLSADPKLLTSDYQLTHSYSNQPASDSKLRHFGCQLFKLSTAISQITQKLTTACYELIYFWTCLWCFSLAISGPDALLRKTHQNLLLKYRQQQFKLRAVKCSSLLLYHTKGNNTDINHENGNIICIMKCGNLESMAQGQCANTGNNWNWKLEIATERSWPSGGRKFSRECWAGLRGSRQMWTGRELWAWRQDKCRCEGRQM